MRVRIDDAAGNISAALVSNISGLLPPGVSVRQGSRSCVGLKSRKAGSLEKGAPPDFVPFIVLLPVRIGYLLNQVLVISALIFTFWRIVRFSCPGHNEVAVLSPNRRYTLVILNLAGAHGRTPRPTSRAL